MMKQRLAWISGLGVGLALALVGCGDDDGGDAVGIESCEAFEACGGDVVGTWTLTGLCLDGLEEMFAGIADQPGCEDFFDNAAIQPQGEYTFDNAGMLSVADARFSFTIDVKLTPACVRGIGGANAMLNASTCTMFQDNLSNNSDSIAGGTCTFAGSTCTCKVSSIEMTLTGAGMYEVRGDQLIQEGDSNPFCVAGDQLTVRTSAASTGAGTLTFQRK